MSDRTYHFIFRHLEKYSSGGRGAPAKGVGRVTGARVQIPPSPFKSQKQNDIFCGKSS